jgi:hypothetical protein
MREPFLLDFVNVLVELVVWVLVMTCRHLVLYEVDVDIQYEYEVDVRYEVHLDIGYEVEVEYLPSQQCIAPSYHTQVLRLWEPSLQQSAPREHSRRNRSQTPPSRNIHLDNTHCLMDNTIFCLEIIVISG